MGIREPIKQHIRDREYIENAERQDERRGAYNNIITKILIILIAPLLFIVLVILNIKEE